MTLVARSGWDIFQFRDFRRFFGVRFLTGLAMQVHNVGLGWLVDHKTGSALALGSGGLAAFLPALLLALIAGAVADRFDRRRIVTRLLRADRARGPGIARHRHGSRRPGLAHLRLTVLGGRAPFLRQSRDAGAAAEHRAEGRPPPPPSPSTPRPGRAPRSWGLPWAASSTRSACPSVWPVEPELHGGVAAHLHSERAGAGGWREARGDNTN